MVNINIESVSIVLYYLAPSLFFCMPSDLSSFADIPFNDSYLSARKFASGGLITLFRECFQESIREC